MRPPSATSEFDERTAEITAAVLLALRQLWSLLLPGSITASWSSVRTAAAAQLAAAQVTAARTGAAYVPAVLDELGMNPQATAAARPEAFAVGSSGMPVDDVLDAAPRRALRVAGEFGPSAGLASGEKLLEGIAETLVADAARLASSVQLLATPSVGWYVRMLEPGACSRCVVLAGRRYRMLEPFPRHDRCRCKHIPVDEDTADDFRTDPAAYFASLSAAEQDRVFTVAGARAIRDGADIGQVVNARRGANGLTPAGARITADEARAIRGGKDYGHLKATKLAGREVYLTTEGVTRRGVAGKAMGNFEATRAPGQRYTRSARQRLMPESIYEIAADRDDALRLLRLYGYLR